MIKSMTGFGRCECADEFRKITVEIKAVNHRYFDVNIKMPKKLFFFETAIRSLLKEYISRGKVDVFVSLEDLSDHDVTVTYNEKLAGAYLAQLQKMAADFGLENDIRTSTLSRYPEVLTMSETPLDEEELGALLKAALHGAAQKFVEVREREGAQLAADLEAKLSNMLENVAKIEARGPGIVSDYRKKLENKVAELLGDVQIDESRLLAELVFFADKICTDEETVRLRSHIASMQETLKEAEGIGRKLDFIAQEMNREANTILSKANDLTTSGIAIELKTEIEKVREQIQNIE